MCAQSFWDMCTSVLFALRVPSAWWSACPTKKADKFEQVVAKLITNTCCHLPPSLSPSLPPGQNSVYQFTLSTLHSSEWLSRIDLRWQYLLFSLGIKFEPIAETVNSVVIHWALLCNALSSPQTSVISLLHLTEPLSSTWQSLSPPHLLLHPTDPLPYRSGVGELSDCWHVWASPLCPQLLKIQILLHWDWQLSLVSYYARRRGTAAFSHIKGSKAVFFSYSQLE